MEIRLAADLQSDSIVDGEGIRTVIWTQGCPHNCFGCHNACTHDFGGGALVDLEYIKEEISNLKAQDGLTFSGGDPMCQPEACSELAKYAKKLGMNIWCYTGYTYEQLIVMSKSNKHIMEFLKTIDVLIDGKFVLELKSSEAIFRGSTNQRLVDVPKSLENHEVILYKLNKKMNNLKKKETIYI